MFYIKHLEQKRLMMNNLWDWGVPQGSFLSTRSISVHTCPLGQNVQKTLPITLSRCCSSFQKFKRVTESWISMTKLMFSHLQIFDKITGEHLIRLVLPQDVPPTV